MSENSSESVKELTTNQEEDNQQNPADPGNDSSSMTQEEVIQNDSFQIEDVPSADDPSSRVKKYDFDDIRNVIERSSARETAMRVALGAICKKFLEDANIRHELSKLSNWPTIPQLFHNGELIGGCDIAVELHNSGELAKIFDK